MADGVPLKIRKLLEEIRGENDLREIGVMTITRNHCRHVVKFDTDINNKHAQQCSAEHYTQINN